MVTLSQHLASSAGQKETSGFKSMVLVVDRAENITKVRLYALYKYLLLRFLT